MAEYWTNTSAPLTSGARKPKPFSLLNHLTVPSAILAPHTDVTRRRSAPTFRSAAGAGAPERRSRVARIVRGRPGGVTATAYPEGRGGRPAPTSTPATNGHRTIT